MDWKIVFPVFGLKKFLSPNNGSSSRLQPDLHKPARALGTLVVSLLKFWVSRLNLLTKPTGLKTMFTFHQQPLPQETERTHGHEHTHGLNLI